MAVSEAHFDVIIDLISSDDRPTFILEPINTTTVQQPAEGEHARIVLRNSALETFVKSLRGDSPSFDSWVSTALPATQVSPASEGARYAGIFGGQCWSSRMLKCGWTVVYCRKQDWSTAAHRDKVEPPAAAYWSGNTVDDSNTTFEGPLTNMLADWIRNKQIGSDPWISYLRAFDWEDTNIGPMDSWHPVLRSHVVTIMACSEPRYILWDDDMKMLYNEAAIPMLGKSHPAPLGKPLASIWGRKRYEQYVSIIRHGIRQGKAVPIREAELIAEQNGSSDETYHNLQITPLTLEDGHYGGALMECTDVTSMVYQRSRQNVITAILERTSTSETLAELWTSSLEILEAQDQDIVYAIVYSVDSQEPPDSSLTSSLEGDTVFRFQASFGIGSTPFSDGPTPDLAKAFADAQDSTLLLQTKVGTLPPELAISISRGVVGSAYIVPVTSSIGARLAHVVLGMNPRRPVDESQIFVTELRDLFARSAALVRLPEDRMQIEKANLALLDQLRLTKVKEEKNEEAFKRMGHRAPVGWFMFAADGQPLYVNDAYLDIFGLTRDEFYTTAKTEFVWGRALYEEDHQSAIELMTRVFEGKQNASFEYRIKTLPGAMQRWMEGTIFSELDDAGNVVSFQGWVSDVSHRKYAETIKEERLQEALDNKRAAERFLDMISHEIRNPISSILLLSEEILSSLPRVEDGSFTLSSENVALMIDAAQNISLCALHQKTISDQVLTFSKLDSNLLVLALERSHPLTIIDHTLKLFASNLTAAGIKTSVQMLPSYNELGLVDVLMDSNRITQVVINLLNNAIKFTKESTVRHITVVIGASQSRPSEGMLPVALLPHRPKSTASSPLPLKATSDAAETPQEVFLHFSVEDTGCGLNESEISHLFRRFTQASPRTHKHYGGSGLGLAISKELVELHGGQIGVKSVPRVGSTFTFYVKAYRAEPDLFPAKVGQGPQGSQGLQSPLPAFTIATEFPIVSINSPTPDMHVLLVEDNPVNQKVTARQLHKAGCKTVHVAEHGLEALDFLASSSFSKSSNSSQQPLTVVLLDIEMPVMDGLSCIRRIRELQKTGELVRHVPVIAITANARQQQIDDAIEAGMDEVQTKPFKIPELIAHMRKLVVKWQSPEQS